MLKCDKKKTLFELIHNADSSLWSEGVKAVENVP